MAINLRVLLFILLLIYCLCFYLWCVYLLKYGNLLSLQQHTLIEGQLVTAYNYDLWLGPVSGEANIMFVDTSCALREKQHRLTPSQACAIESAARAHPLHKIYVFHTCHTDMNRDLPVHRDEYMRHFHRLPNVFFVHLNVSRMVEGTIVDSWWAKRPENSSQWQEVISLVLLWKYGGIYMDLNFVVIRSLSQLSNFIVAEGDSLMSNVFGFNSVGSGHQQVEEFLNEINSTFSGNKRSDAGQNLLTRVMLRSCDVSQVSEMTEERCNGIRILPPITFYPKAEVTRHLDQSDDANNTLMTSLLGDERTKAIHVRNQLNVTVGSDQLYGLLAVTYCPHVYSGCDDTFY